MAIIIGKRTNLDAPIKVESLHGVTFTSEAEAHQFVVRCAQNGQDLTLAGTISAKFIRADGNTIQLVGSIVDGAAVVTLAQDCYNVQGRFQLAIFNTVGNTKLCIYACVGTVQKAQSGNLIDGGDIIPDVEDLIADIEAARQSIPPTYDELLASIAGTYDSTKTYAVGDYVWYDGSLYRCTTAITTAEAWTSGHWTAAVLGNDVADLKNATKQKEVALDKYVWATGGIGSNGDDYNRNTSIRTQVYLDSHAITRLVCADGSLAFVAFYDSNKQFVRRNAISTTSVNVRELNGFDSSVYLRVELSNTAITDFEKLLVEYTIACEIDNIASKIDNIADEIYPLVGRRVFLRLQNGTIGNPANANAVCTSYVDCKAGETVTFYPIRPNVPGFYYLYGYRTYDENKNVIRQVDNAAEGLNALLVQGVEVFVRFFVVESNGTEYNPLRTETYGYDPYFVVNEGELVRKTIDRIISEYEFLQSAQWVNGGIDSQGDTSADNRIRTADYIEVGYAEKIRIMISAGYRYALSYFDANKAYITSSSVWQTNDVTINNDNYPSGTSYLRVTLRRTDNQAISINEHSNISGKLTIIAKNAFDYFSNIKLVKTEQARIKAHYNDLLSQARFSPTGNANVLTLMHFSDIHGNLTAMKKAMELKQDYFNKIDDFIHTGDVVVANWSNGIANWIASGCAESVISVVGNHDSEENLVLGTAGKDNVYNGMLAPYIANWGVVQPTGVSDSASPYYCACYYYKDYPSVSIRLIVLDTNWWDSYEKTWLAEVLTDAKTNGYSIILACHTPRFVTGITEANFCSYTEPIINEPAAYANIPNDWLDPVNDFIDDGGEVICMLSGHNHRDHIGYLTNYPRVLCITADKASVARTIDTARVSGEENATAFNAITFNTTDKWIKIVRFGAEVDGQMRGKHVFCYDYANKRIISQW